ncbi:zinc finger E-box-binding homeobox 1 X3 [Biomphalaria glabrata]|nr:zinc finger E-box-binding homeobox 1 X3 [Biomphalaria glabrata]
MMGCPVPQCPANASCFKAKAYFLRHWTEKHEPKAVHYKCDFCSLTTKRKSYTAKHTLMTHGVIIQSSPTNMLIKANKEYIDPSPITLAMCIGTASGSSAKEVK